METKTEKPQTERLMSLDTLRGFDMFWIAGGENIFHSLAKVTNWPVAVAFAGQLDHVPWAGLKMYDLIFPTFVFMAGVSMPYSLLGKLEKGAPKREVLWRVYRRVLLLILLGFIYNGLLQFNWPEQRYASVLGLIGISYGIGASILVFTKSLWARLGWLFGILVGYALTQLFEPVPGGAAGALTPDGCINGWVDRQFLPGVLYGKVYDPEGLLCVLSAGALSLMGALAGTLLRNVKIGGYPKFGILLGCGFASILIGLVCWLLGYPPIKAAWSSTFNLLAGGIASVLLSVFYLVIDVWKCRKWTLFFRVIGMNAITIYIGSTLIPWDKPAEGIFGGIARSVEPWGGVVMAVGVVAVEWVVLYYLYTKKTFLRV